MNMGTGEPLDRVSRSDRGTLALWNRRLHRSSTVYVSFVNTAGDIFTYTAKEIYIHPDYAELPDANRRGDHRAR